MKAIRKRVDERGSATERKPGSGRPKTARTEKNVRYLVMIFDYELSLNMALSEPQYSLCCTIKETDSKAEQGNDNLIACGSNDDLTATENNSTKSVTI